MLDRNGPFQFSEVIDSLDKTLEHSWHVLLPKQAGEGRAYVSKENEIYGGPIFFGNRGEEHYNRIRGLEGSRQYKGGVYMGAAGIVNLSYIAVLRSERAILFDVNPHQKIFWDVFLKLIKDCEDKADLPAAFEAAQPELARRIASAQCGNSIGHFFQNVASLHFKDGGLRPLYNGDLPLVSTFERRPLGELIWYEDDLHYAYVREMIMQGRIGALTLDVCDKKSIASLVSVLGEERLSYLYISNIMAFFARGSDWTDRRFSQQVPSEALARNALGLLLSQDSLVISNNRVMAADWRQNLCDPVVMGSCGNADTVPAFE